MILAPNEFVPEGKTDAQPSSYDGTGAFAESIKFECPRFDLSVGQTTADAVTEAAERALVAATSKGRPYTVHPLAAERDAIIEYDERDPESVERFREESQLAASEAGALSTKLRRVLLARSADRVERDHERGTLDRSRLARMNLPGRTPSRRIFTKTRRGQTHKVAVGILVDQSASMAEIARGRSKIQCARIALIAIGESLAQLASLGVTFGAWGFSCDWQASQAPEDAKLCGGQWDRLGSVRIHEYKAIGERWASVAPRIGAMEPGRNNADGESVRWAAAQLLAAKTDRRMLIVLSDGRPNVASTYKTNDRLERDLRRAIVEVAGLGIETLGVGVTTDAVRSYYPRHVVIDDPADLSSELVGGLAEMFHVDRGR